MEQMQVKNSKKDKHRKILTPIMITAIVAILIRLFCFSTVIVEGTSMVPTFEDGQIVLVNKLAYINGEPEIDDIVIAVEPLENRRVIKRITGVPGSTVEYQGKLICLAEDEIFIEGDNENSIDSASYGPIKMNRLIGKVIT